MEKRPVIWGSQRVDQPALDEGLAWAFEVQKDLMQHVFGKGLMDGFRIRVKDQSANPGEIEIFTGQSIDNGGALVNLEDSTNYQTMKLGSAQTEYWIEIELYTFTTDPDTVTLWDPTVDNTSPIPDGGEVEVANIDTRLAFYWRAVLRSNSANTRSAGGYTPTRFSDFLVTRFPIAVLKTNVSGVIEGGGANDTTAYGNDLVTVTNASGTQTFVRPVGYGEARLFESNGDAKVVGQKTSDQRQRFFERLVPPMLYGASGELLGDQNSDHWARDLKSWCDHVMTAILEIKEGAGTGSQGNADFGQYNSCGFVAFASDFSYIDTDVIYRYETSANTVTAYEDQYMNCTVQFLEGPWAGFYARVTGNDATGTHVGGQTRLFLQHHSPVPDWMPLPPANSNKTAMRIVQQRQKNWVDKPSPSSSNRGLNALDTEVVSARTDGYGSNITFDNLAARLDANRSTRATVSRFSTKDEATGQPTDQATIAADIYGSSGATSASIITELNTAITQNSLGNVLFRRRDTASEGSYTYLQTISFNDLLGASQPETIFNYSNLKGIEFRGEGVSETVLEFGARVARASGVMSGTSTSSSENHRLFRLEDCEDITFRDLTIRGSGRILDLIRCNQVRFINCKFENIIASTFQTFGSAISGWSMIHINYEKSGSPVVSGTANRISFEGCEFSGYGEALLTVGSSSRLMLRDCRFNSTDSTYNSACVALVSTQDSLIENCIFEGQAALSALSIQDSDRVRIQNNRFETILAGGSGLGLFYSANYMRDCFIENNTFGRNGTTPASNYEAVEVANSMERCHLNNNSVLGLNEGFELPTPQYCVIKHNRFIGRSTSSTSAISMADNDFCIVEGNIIRTFTNGISAIKSQNSHFLSNNIKSCQNGIVLGTAATSGDASSYCVVTGNVIDGVSSVFATGYTGILMPYGETCIANNNFIQTHEYGIRVNSGTDCNVSTNNILACQYGLFFNSANRCILNSNHIDDASTRGISLNAATDCFAAGNFLTTIASATVAVDLGSAVRVRGGGAYINPGSTPYTNDGGSGANDNEFHLYNFTKGLATSPTS